MLIFRWIKPGIIQPEGLVTQWLNIWQLWLLCRFTAANTNWNTEKHQYFQILFPIPLSKRPSIYYPLNEWDSDVQPTRLGWATSLKNSLFFIPNLILEDLFIYLSTCIFFKRNWKCQTIFLKTCFHFNHPVSGPTWNQCPTKKNNKKKL